MTIGRRNHLRCHRSSIVHAISSLLSPEQQVWKPRQCILYIGSFAFLKSSRNSVSIHSSQDLNTVWQKMKKNSPINEMETSEGVILHDLTLRELCPGSGCSGSEGEVGRE